ncbi:MAG: hypothetical protein QOH58_512 [Thermoleophilaceae bacterium]|jgi:formate dehydrogenase maturation protein FdhE|nr:hypothetical protein [Thermoleophilaceae bacterium]
MIRFAAAPLALLLLALGLSACGGDDAPSRAEYTADVERICNEAQKQAEKVGENATSPADIAKAIDTVIDDTRKSMDDLQALDRPEGDAGELADKFVDATVSDTEDKGIPVLEDLRDALKEDDQKAAQKAIERLQALQTSDADKFARELGADACVT